MQCVLRLNSSRIDKWSAHLHVRHPRVSFLDICHVKTFVKYMQQFLTGDAAKIMDLSVYHPCRQFRMIYSSKLEQQSGPLLPEGPGFSTFTLER